MHFLVSLMILSGLLFAFCVGLVILIRDLSEMSFHVSPPMPSTPHSPTTGAGRTHANTIATGESNPVEVSEME